MVDGVAERLATWAFSATMSPVEPVGRDFYRRDVLEVAPELLNTLLVAGERVGRIVEVEAYRGLEDPASHAYRGRTRRNATMWGPPGHLYVYFTYGMHFCANAVCAEQGVAQAVLIRALAPVAGLEAMRSGRPAARRDTDLASGPAKACAALGIDLRHDGADLVTGRQGVRIASDGTPPPIRPGRGARIGISVATQVEWRWWVPGEANLSRPERPLSPKG